MWESCYLSKGLAPLLQSLCKYFWCYLEYLWKGSQVRIDDAAGMSKGVLFVTEEEEEDYDDCEDHNDDGVHNVQGDQRDFLLELSAERPEIQVD